MIVSFLGSPSSPVVTFLPEMSPHREQDVACLNQYTESNEIFALKCRKTWQVESSPLSLTVIVYFYYDTHTKKRKDDAWNLFRFFSDLCSLRFCSSVLSKEKSMCEFVIWFGGFEKSKHYLQSMKLNWTHLAIWMIPWMHIYIKVYSN